MYQILVTYNLIYFLNVADILSGTPCTRLNPFYLIAGLLQAERP